MPLYYLYLTVWFKKKNEQEAPCSYRIGMTRTYREGGFETLLGVGGLDLIHTINRYLAFFHTRNIELNVHRVHRIATIIVHRADRAVVAICAPARTD